MVTKEEFNAAMDRIDKRFEQVFLRFDHIDDMLAILVKRGDHHQDRLDDHERRIRKLETH